jgi:UDP-N-acetylglucosamine diphosphorylase / glucose-1-phosphate thymidylyltransferase / UDP-N-acetylgalactosamine diphosphorylase / glucosamine-1-phosphate N-acetyltransferase / galactosamine-1-phosphate N-acetyltransferase
MHRFNAGSLFDSSRTLAAPLFGRTKYAWEILPELGAFILEAALKLPGDYERISETVWASRSARIASSACLEGPAIIGRETEIRHCAYVRQNVIIGDGAFVGNSTELKNAILMNAAQAPHFNYVGDSIMGYRSHIGAGVILSNLKLDYRTVVIRDNGETIDTGLQKFGALIGDRTEIGCNSVLNPGTVVGPDCTIYPLSFVRGYIPPRSIFKRDGTMVPKAEKGRS